MRAIAKFAFEKMQLTLLSTITILLFVGCSHVDNQHTDVVDTCREGTWIDTSQLNVRVRLRDSACSYFIVWTVGNKMRHVDLKNDLKMEWINTADVVPFRWISNDFICVRFGCGMPCWNDVILPFAEEKKPIVIRDGFWHNNEVIVSASLTSDHILIYALKNGQKIDSMENPISKDNAWDTNGGGALLYNIDTVNISNDTLFVGKFDEDHHLIRTKKKRIKI